MILLKYFCNYLDIFRLLDTHLVGVEGGAAAVVPGGGGRVPEDALHAAGGGQDRSRDQVWTNHSSPEAVLGAGEEVGEGDLHRDVRHHAPPGLVDVRTHDTGVHLQ